MDILTSVIVGIAILVIYHKYYTTKYDKSEIINDNIETNDVKDYEPQTYYDPFANTKVDIHEYFAVHLKSYNDKIITYFDTKYTFSGSENEISLIANLYFNKAVDNVDNLLYISELGFRTNKSISIICILYLSEDNSRHTTYITFNAKEYWSDDSNLNRIEGTLTDEQSSKLKDLKTKYF